ncbi:hypothetical protein M404DRAFT_1009177 [Pisolithus tinctorius Marx 270]|uniref:Uncharacterized protein n=1 Tax=Pisolithus tinctorius Marx 270 TaxID=870435 RepID=A0A0C3NB64_PISTI|nr:hypothetical protein M404DRAFT_1009177 [Pisolithus tinctorius Marx 270]
MARPTNKSPKYRQLYKFHLTIVGPTTYTYTYIESDRVQETGQNYLALQRQAHNKSSV